MGNIPSVLSKRISQVIDTMFASKDPTSMAILGLDAAGKTSLVNLFRNREGTPVPTLGFNLDSVTIGGTTIKIWDIGGQRDFITFWASYVKEVQGLVFMVDIADESRFEAAFDGFRTIVPHLTNNIPVLLLLNKVDVLAKEGIDAKARMDRVKSIFKINDADFERGVCMKHDTKVFRTHCMLTSVREDTEKMVNHGHSWTIQDSGVFTGFKWLIDEMKNSNHVFNKC
ncbi:ADP-ribosylation factor-like protein 8 [Pancytospora philotis]|nr:ADP-ribosylation factor-like protein 8 [Pancytospora philotis]